MDIANLHQSSGALIVLGIIGALVLGLIIQSARKGSITALTFLGFFTGGLVFVIWMLLEAYSVSFKVVMPFIAIIGFIASVIWVLLRSGRVRHSSGGFSCSQGNGYSSNQGNRSENPAQDRNLLAFTDSLPSYARRVTKTTYFLGTPYYDAAVQFSIFHKARIGPSGDVNVTDSFEGALKYAGPDGFILVIQLQEGIELIPIGKGEYRMGIPDAKEGEYYYISDIMLVSVYNPDGTWCEIDSCNVGMDKAGL